MKVWFRGSPGREIAVRKVRCLEASGWREELGLGRCPGAGCGRGRYADVSTDCGESHVARAGVIGSLRRELLRLPPLPWTLRFGHLRFLLWATL